MNDVERVFKKAVVLFCPVCKQVRTWIRFHLCPRCGEFALPGVLLTPELACQVDDDPCNIESKGWSKWTSSPGN
mgnify:CR=1 FL=1